MKVILVSRCAWTLYNFRSGVIRSLVESGVTVLCGGAGGDGFEADVERLGATFRPLNCDGGGLNPLADGRFLFELYRWYRSEQPDAVHHFTIKPVIYGSIAARLASVPRIINTVTGLGYAFTGTRPWVRTIVELEYRLALAGADLTFFQNADDLGVFLARRLIDPRRADVIPGSGIDLSRFKTVERTPPPGDHSKISFLMVARLLKDKGVYEFVEAARVVKKQYPAASFTIVGWADRRNPSAISNEEVERWQQEGVIRWLGKLRDVRDQISVADVLVLPSYREGTPRSLLEGAAMGKPLIATDTPGCREVIDHGINGLLVQVRSVRALADAMIRLIEDPWLRERMGKAGRQKIEREFDEKIVLKKTFGAYGIPLPVQGTSGCR